MKHDEFLLLAIHRVALLTKQKPNFITSEKSHL